MGMLQASRGKRAFLVLSGAGRSLMESCNREWSKTSLESEGKKKAETSDAQLHTNQMKYH